jgi:hypothetical protein
LAVSSIDHLIEINMRPLGLDNFACGGSLNRQSVAIKPALWPPMQMAGALVCMYDLSNQIGGSTADEALGTTSQ